MYSRLLNINNKRCILQIYTLDCYLLYLFCINNYKKRVESKGGGFMKPRLGYYSRTLVECQLKCLALFILKLHRHLQSDWANYIYQILLNCFQLSPNKTCVSGHIPSLSKVYLCRVSLYSYIHMYMIHTFLCFSDPSIQNSCLYIQW